MRSKPNVIWILTDDQGTLDAHCYGARHLYTPHIDSLARDGVKFTRAYSHTVCCPARANLLTGRHAQRVGINNWTQADAAGAKGINIHADEMTAAAIFREQGYRTGLFGKWHLGAAPGHRPLDMGFDAFFGFLGGFIENYTQYSLHGRGFHDLWDGQAEIDCRNEYFPRLTNDRAMAFIEQNQDHPFFLYLPYNLPHYPEQSEDKYAGQYKNVDQRVRKYGMTVSTVDGLIGEVLEKVEQLGLSDDTIVLFMSDNGHSCEACRLAPNHRSGLPEGWYYGAHGAGYAGPFKGHKADLTEGGIRVPCILKAPGRTPAGVESDHTVCGLDWLPTMLSLCGIQHKPARPFDGIDLSPSLSDAAEPGEERVLHWQWASRWAVMRGDWKLIGSNEQASRELLNVCDENPEAVNYLAGRWPSPAHEALARDLEQDHARWLAEVGPCYQEPADCGKDKE